MHVYYTPESHMLITYNLLEAWGNGWNDPVFLEEEGIFCPLIQLVAEETYQELFNFVLTKQKELQNVLLSHGTPALLHVIYEWLQGCENQVSMCLIESINTETMHEAWDRVESEILPALAEPTCVISFH